MRRIKFSGILYWIAIFVYVFNVLGIIFTVILNSLSKNWYTDWFPKIFTLEWYSYMAKEHDLTQLLFATFVVVISVALISLLIGYPAAYIFARYNFKFKNVLLSLLLVPMLVPPMTYGIPLAAMLYKLRLATRISGVILANLVPIIPYVVLILYPFIEQIDVSYESAARILGASRLRTFVKVLLPLTVPGIFTAALLSIVRTIAMFELTFLVAGPKSQTVIVALYYDAYAAGTRPPQAIDALAVVYFLITMTFLLIALKFASPTQFVYRGK
jgi:putative spermidine/putrescine transport system permease protein